MITYCDKKTRIIDLSCFYELLVIRLPNKKQTACETCPGNLVANATIGVCWCPLGDLVFNDKYDNCEYFIGQSYIQLQFFTNKVCHSHSWLMAHL